VRSRPITKGFRAFSRGLIRRTPSRKTTGTVYDDFRAQNSLLTDRDILLIRFEQPYFLFNGVLLPRERLPAIL
jgi:hypothetical protein